MYRKIIITAFLLLSGAGTRLLLKEMVWIQVLLPGCLRLLPCIANDPWSCNVLWGTGQDKNGSGDHDAQFAAMGVMTVLWVVIGYSMSFGSNVLGGWFGWNNDYFFLKGIDESVLNSVFLNMCFQCSRVNLRSLPRRLLQVLLPRGSILRVYILFITFWGILVYNPLCHWVWAEDGFLYNMGANGAIDFAGGTVVHISAGVSGLVTAIFLGPRKGYNR